MGKIIINHGLPGRLDGKPTGFFVGAGYGLIPEVTSAIDRIGEMLLDAFDDDITLRCDTAGTGGGAFCEIPGPIPLAKNAYFNMETRVRNGGLEMRLVPPPNLPKIVYSLRVRLSRKEELIYMASFVTSRDNRLKVKTNLRGLYSSIDKPDPGYDYSEGKNLVVYSRESGSLEVTFDWLKSYGRLFCPFIKEKGE